VSTVDLDLSTTTPQAPPPASRASGAERRVPDVAYSVAAVLLLLGLWFALSRSSFIKPGYLPTPEELWSTFVELVKNGYQGKPLTEHIGISLFRTLSGFALGVVFGVPVGLLAGYSRRAGAMISPIMAFIRPIPPIAFIPMAVLYFGLGETGKIVLIFFVSFNYVQANDVCIQCHSQGQPLKNPIQGKYYDWPVGFDVGKNLVDFWKLEEHKLGEQSFTHFADGTAHKNRMQGNDFVQSLMYTRGVTCFSCHDVHGTKNDAILWKPAANICFDCHGPNTPNGPHAPTIEAHTHHKPGSTGSECIACHMPKIAQTIGDVNVRAHTFRFITPSESEALKIPNACNLCHKDKTTAWATGALRSWQDRSPWRVGQ